MADLGSMRGSYNEKKAETIGIGADQRCAPLAISAVGEGILNAVLTSIINYLLSSGYCHLSMRLVSL